MTSPLRRLLVPIAVLGGLSACSSGSRSAATGASPTPTPEASATPGGTATGTPTPTDHVTIGGGQVSRLNFAIVGDTRPAVPDDTGAYPTAIITKIWQDVEAEAQRPPFAVTTGDYVFADPFLNEAPKQLDLFLGARAGYSGTVFYALGNHECNSLTQSNCGPGTISGVTKNYQAFLDKMMTPLGQTTPYYYVKIDAFDGSWTSKFVFVAPNAWHDDQKAWLETVMSIPTTYTFVVRHEDVDATTAPGVPESNAILAAHPYTLLLAGHVHTFRWTPSKKQVITGNGGAPLNTGVNYGYTVIRQLEDGTLTGENYDYESHAVIGSFHVDRDGAEVN